MQRLKNIIGLIVVAIIIIIFYIGMLSSILFFMSLIPILQIEVSWAAVFIFSTFIMIWTIPYEIISFLMNLRIRKDSIRRLVWYTTVLLNFIVFTLYVIWVDSFITGIHFSNIGLIVYIIVIALLVVGIKKGGVYLEKRDNKQDS